MMQHQIRMAKMAVSPSPLPPGASLVAWIVRHPADKIGPGYAVIRTLAGVEVAWDGSGTRSLPPRWRSMVEHEEVG